MCRLPHNPRVSESPVPIPPLSAPGAAPAWSLTDAVPWTRAGPAFWAGPVWCVSALLITVAWAFAVEPAPACSDAAPCAPDWGGMAQTGLAVGLLYWLARLPELAVIAAPALAVMVAWGELPGAATSRAANSAVLGALCFGWAAARERLAARSAQRRLVERVAGTRHRLAEPAGPLVRGRLSIITGLVLCAVAAGAVLVGQHGIRADERHADRASRITATVLDRDEETVRVRADDGRRITVDAVYPEDHGVGSTVTVLEDGSWRRLRAEPYDPFGWQLLVLAAGLPGLSFLTAGVLARRRAAAPRRAPVPALRVLERTDHEGRTWVYAADDRTGRTALFTCFCTTALPPGEEDDDPVDRVAAGAEHEGDDDEDEFRVDTRMREAVLLGTPCDGGELLLVTTGPPRAGRSGRPTGLPSPAGRSRPRPRPGPPVR